MAFFGRWCYVIIGLPPREEDNEMPTY